MCAYVRVYVCVCVCVCVEGKGKGVGERDRVCRGMEVWGKRRVRVCVKRRGRVRGKGMRFLVSMC